MDYTYIRDEKTKRRVLEHINYFRYDELEDEFILCVDTSNLYMVKYIAETIITKDDPVVLINIIRMTYRCRPERCIDMNINAYLFQLLAIYLIG